MENTALTEQSRPEHVPLVQQVGHGVRVRGQSGREQDTLVQLSHFLQELVIVRPLEDVYLVYCTIYLYRHDEVSITNRFERRMNQRLVQVNNKTLLVHVSRMQFWQQSLLLWLVDSWVWCASV